jgi:glycosyltransferase involved in cell wall biosynthesis
MKLISVIIPTRNRTSSLNVAIESVLNQSYDNIELIIVDDFSDVPVTLESKYKNIKIFRNEKRMGAAASRNKGVQFCTGEYVAFLDDDDIYYENKLECLYDEMSKNENLDLVFGKIKLFNGYKSKDQVNYPKKFNEKINCLIGNYIHTNSSLMKKKVASIIQFDEGLERFQDTQFYLDVSTSFNIKFCDVYAAQWNVNHVEGSITSDDTFCDKYRTYRSFLKLKEKHDVYHNVLYKKIYFIYYEQVLRYKFFKKINYNLIKKLAINPFLALQFIKVFICREIYLNKRW